MEKKRSCIDFLGVGTEEKRLMLTNGTSVVANKNPVSVSVRPRSDVSPDLNLSLNITPKEKNIESNIGGEKAGEKKISNADSPIIVNDDDPIIFGFSGDVLVLLKEGDEEHGFVQNKFIQGLGSLGKHMSVVGIHKNSHSGFLGQARLKAFQTYSEAMANRCGGNANIKYAWRATSEDEVPAILLHGFSPYDRPATGVTYGYGFGLYLAPEDSSINCALSSVIDKNGVQHMVFCRVIMGKMEHVPAGSKQFHPSSEQFDSGVDDLISPKRYIVWTTNLNTHVLVEYIVSFKVHDYLKELWTNHCLKKNPQPNNQKLEMTVKKPTSPWMPFPRLISVLIEVLPPSSSSVLKKHHTDFLEKKITREQLVRHLRQLAGDRLLITAIKSFRAKFEATIIPSSSEESSTCTGNNSK